MKNDPIFSKEYDSINLQSTSANKMVENIQLFYGGEKYELLKKIQEEYPLLKPKRVIITARIIKK